MRSVVARSLGALVGAALLAACGSSPSAPDLPASPVPTGPQVLRLTLSGPCSLDGTRGAPVVYTRVTIARTASEWIATASSPSAGDIELRFHQSGPSALAGSIPITGTIKGTAMHAAELMPVPLPAAERASFGADGRTTLDGFAFSTSAIAPVNGLDGFGVGTVTFTIGAGQACSGSTFMWSVAAAPGPDR